MFVLDTNMASLLAIRMAQNCMLQEMDNSSQEGCALRCPCVTGFLSMGYR